MTDLCIVSRHGLVHRRNCTHVLRAHKVKGVTPLQARVFQLPFCTGCLNAVDYDHYKKERVA